LVMDRRTGALRDDFFSGLGANLRRGDLLVLNDSRVIPARLYARRTLVRDHEKPTGRIEVMLLEAAGENQWRALVRPGRKIAIGERLVFLGHTGEIVLEAEVLGRGKFNDRLMRKGFRENRSRRNDANKQMRTWEGVRLREDVTLPLDNGSGRSGDYREF